MPFNIDIAIVLAFLLITLAVGLNHGQKVKNIKDYALGGRNFSTGALVATVVATWASGSGFFVTLSKTYSDGFYYMFARFGLGIYFLIVSFIFIPRMAEFLGKISIAEAMGDIYGKKVRFITALAGSIGSAGSIAVQFKVFGSIFSYFLHTPNYLAIIVSGFITTLYSAFGGIRAVTFTDILQFFAFGVIIPVLGFVIWNEFYYQGYSIVETISEKKFNLAILFNPSNDKFYSFLFLFIYVAIPTWSASMFQRVSIGNSISQVKKAFLIAGIILILIQIIVAWIPFLMYKINPDIQPKYLLSYIVDHYSSNGLKGLVLIAIIAFAMSTADSRINSASVLFTHDLYGLLVKGKKNEIFISRFFASLLGIGAILFALIDTDILGILIFANSFYYPLVTLPFILTVMGFRSSEKSVLIGMSAGLIVTVLWKFLPIEFTTVSQKIVGMFLAMLCNTVFLIGSHYLLRQPGGWINTKDPTYFRTKDNNSWIVKFSDCCSKLNFMKYCQKISLNNDSTYSVFGVYFIACTFTTMYSTQVELLGVNRKLILYIYQLMMVTGTVISMYPIWPLSVSKSIKETIIRIWWPIAIFYMLIFFSCFFVMVSKFLTTQVGLFCINIILASILLGWRVALPMIIIGFYLSIQLYQYLFPELGFEVQFGSPEFILIYLVLLLSSVIIVFIKPNQEYLEKTEEQADYFKDQAEKYKGTTKHFSDESEKFLKAKQNLEKQLDKKSGDLKDTEKYLKDKLKLMHIEVEKLQEMKNEFIRNILHESNTPMTSVLSLSEVLHSCYDKLDEGDIKQSLKGIVRGGERLKSYVNNIADLSKLSSLSYKLNIQPINLTTLVKQRPNLYTKIFADDKKQEFIFNIKEDIIILCDEYYLTQAIDNLISNAVQYGKGKPINITLEQVPGEKNELAVEKVKFEIKDQGIGIPEIELVNIFDTFTVSSKTKTIAGGRGVGLALCEKIIKLHDGEIHCKSDGKTGSTFSFIIPGFVGAIEDAF